MITASANKETTCLSMLILYELAAIMVTLGVYFFILTQGTETKQTFAFAVSVAFLVSGGSIIIAVTAYANSIISSIAAAGAFGMAALATIIATTANAGVLTFMVAYAVASAAIFTAVLSLFTDKETSLDRTHFSLKSFASLLIEALLIMAGMWFITYHAVY